LYLPNGSIPGINNQIQCCLAFYHSLNLWFCYLFQVSYLVSALLVLVTLLGIAPLFYYLPKCVLASVVIVACIPLFVHYTMWLVYWRTDRYDFSIWIVTFVMTFIAGVDYGLVIGVGFSLVVVHFRMQVITLLFCRWVRDLGRYLR
jgi:Sulfate permease family